MSRLRAVENTDAPQFELVPFDKLQLGKERAYLIKGLIPLVGLTVFCGGHRNRENPSGRSMR
jgi:hypothetical protein